MRRVIAQIIGQPGSGKSEVTHHAAQRGFQPVKVSGLIEEYALPRGIALDTRQDYLAALQQMRRELGKTVLSRTITCMLEPRIWVDGLRGPGDVAIVRRQGPVIALDCPPEIRYERIAPRNRTLDRVTFEQFVEDELRESENSDPFAPATAAVIRSADYQIDASQPLVQVLEEVDAIIEPYLAV